MTELATRQLTKTYGDRPALEPLTLKIDSGAKVALVGHNGSGKTTLMKMAAGLLDPSDGSVKIGRHDAGSQQARRLLSWLSDTPTFYDDLSLWEHLEFVARLHGVVDWQQRAEELIDEIGLTARRDDIPTTFSRGLRQKAAITLAFIRPFNLMLVDEPFVGLDEPGKQALLALFESASRRGATLVIATHDLTFVKQVGRLLALRDGELVYDGAPADTDVHALVLPS
ncbi:MAG TPA: ABC transporter ATP-binding protein [Ilumatobacteraceae bacterium]|nr:ABC transporter ATP-binding protein [Ilumatobacteraceae bacterium]